MKKEKAYPLTIFADDLDFFDQAILLEYLSDLFFLDVDGEITDVELTVLG